MAGAIDVGHRVSLEPSRRVVRTPPWSLIVVTIGVASHHARRIR